MLKFSQAVEYAILILISVVDAKKPLSLNEISRGRNLPIKYLEKICVRLKAGGLIKSKEGKLGGYLLAKPALKISLKAIIDAVEGKTGLVSCIYGMCQQKTNCQHKQVWVKMQNTLEKEMAKISLVEFCS